MKEELPVDSNRIDGKSFLLDNSSINGLNKA
jgi:hypothetical protein